MKRFAAALGAMVFAFGGAAVAQTALNTAAIDAALGRAGSLMPGDVYRVSFPRSDLHVTVGRVTLAPGLALGSYAAFKQEPSTVLVVGDLVLTEREIQPVMERLERSGFEITALHNHLRKETPHVMYLHYMGTGEAAALAASLRSALVLSATPLAAPKKPDITSPWFAGAIQDGLGVTGKAANGVLAIGIPRAQDVTMRGYAVPPAMGVGIALNFQSAGSGLVATTGDFVLVADEVAAVQQALIAHGFEVTALHHHMVGDSPQLYYLHFWAVAPPAQLAAALKDALSHVAIKRP